MAQMKMIQSMQTDKYTLEKNYALFHKIISTGTVSRSAETQKIVKECLKEIPFFEKRLGFFDPFVFKILMEKIQLEEHNSKGFVILEGEKSDKLFVVLSGTCIGLDKRHKDKKLRHKKSKKSHMNEDERLSSKNENGRKDSSVTPSSQENSFYSMNSGLQFTRSNNQRSPPEFFQDFGQPDNIIGEEATPSRRKTQGTPAKLFGLAKVLKKMKKIDEIPFPDQEIKKMFSSKFSVKSILNKFDVFGNDLGEETIKKFSMVVTGDNKTVLISLNSENYKEILDLNSRVENERRISLLLSVPEFQNWSRAHATELSSHLKERKVPIFSLLSRPGEKVESLSIVYKGSVQLERETGVSRNNFVQLVTGGELNAMTSTTITIKNGADLQAAGSFSDVLIPVNEAKLRLDCVVTSFPIIELGRGHLFGEEILEEVKLRSQHYTIRATSNTVLLEISNRRFRQFLKDRFLFDATKQAFALRRKTWLKKFQEKLFLFCVRNFGNIETINSKQIQNTSAFRDSPDSPKYSMHPEPGKKYHITYSHSPTFIKPKHPLSHFPLHETSKFQKDNDNKGKIIQKLASLSPSDGSMGDIMKEIDETLEDHKKEIKKEANNRNQELIRKGQKQRKRSPEPIQEKESPKIPNNIYQKAVLVQSTAGKIGADIMKDLRQRNGVGRLTKLSKEYARRFIIQRRAEEMQKNLSKSGVSQALSTTERKKKEKVFPDILGPGEVSANNVSTQFETEAPSQRDDEEECIRTRINAKSVDFSQMDKPKSQKCSDYFRKIRSPGGGLLREKRRLKAIESPVFVFS